MTSAPVVAAVLAVLCAVLLGQVPARHLAARTGLVTAMLALVGLACVLP